MSEASGVNTVTSVAGVSAVTASVANSFKEERSVASLRLHAFHDKIPTTRDGTERLKAGIKRDGIREPLHVLADGTILAGRNRWLIAKELGLTELPVVVRADLVTEDQQVAFMIAENIERNQWPEPVLIELIDLQHGAQERLEAQARKAHKEEWKGAGPPPEKTTRSNDILGKRAGVSGKHFGYALDLIKRFRDGTAPIGQLYYEQILTCNAAKNAAEELDKDAQEKVRNLVHAATYDDKKKAAREAIKAALSDKKPKPEAPKAKAEKEQVEPEGEKPGLEAAKLSDTEVKDEKPVPEESRPAGKSEPVMPENAKPETESAQEDDLAVVEQALQNCDAALRRLLCSQQTGLSPQRVHWIRKLIDKVSAAGEECQDFLAARTRKIAA